MEGPDLLDLVAAGGEVPVVDPPRGGLPLLHKCLILTSIYYTNVMKITSIYYTNALIIISIYYTNALIITSIQYTNALIITSI